MDCPCTSGQAYESCCQAYHQGDELPLTAELLMRSRYSAYVMKDEKYLLETWDESTRPWSLELKEDNVEWQGLKILKRKKGREDDEKGTVEFVAKFKAGAKNSKLHEISDFRKVDGRWIYVRGSILR